MDKPTGKFAGNVAGKASRRQRRATNASRTNATNETNGARVTTPGQSTAASRVHARPQHASGASGASASRLGTPGATRKAPPYWSRKRIAIVAALWVLGLMLLTLMSVFAHADPTFLGDVGLEEAIQRIQQPILDAIINTASNLNWPTPAGIIAIVVILALAVLRQIRAAVTAAFSGFGADFVNVTLNGVVARPRPNDVHIKAVAHLGLHSFPSGHVTHVAAFYGFLLYLCADYERRYPQWRRPLLVGKLICAYFLVFVGISRVLEGEHWPSDVLGGYLLGGLFLVVAILLYHQLARVDLRAWWASRHKYLSPAR